MPQTAKMGKKQLKKYLLSAVEGTSVNVLKELLHAELVNIESPSEEQWIWVRDAKMTAEDPAKGTVEYEFDQKTYKRPYTVSADGTTVSLGERTEGIIKEEFVELGDEPVVEPPKEETETPQETEVKVTVTAEQLAKEQAKTQLLAKKLKAKAVSSSKARMKALFAMLSKPNSNNKILPPKIIGALEKVFLSIYEKEDATPLFLSKHLVGNEGFKLLLADGAEIEGADIAEPVQEVMEAAQEAATDETVADEIKEFSLAEVLVILEQIGASVAMGVDKIKESGLVPIGAETASDTNEEGVVANANLAKSGDRSKIIAERADMLLSKRDPRIKDNYGNPIDDDFLKKHKSEAYTKAAIIAEEELTKEGVINNG